MKDRDLVWPGDYVDEETWEEMPMATDLYVRHFATAVFILRDFRKAAGDDDARAAQLLAEAQVHATLAQAAAVTGFHATYNGWKDLGR